MRTDSYEFLIVRVRVRVRVSMDWYGLVGLGLVGLVLGLELELGLECHRAVSWPCKREFHQQ